jgi:VanZ family protein
MPAMNNSDEKRAAQGLLLAYCLFILYGSFIPFHFDFDPNFARWRWSLFLTDSLHERIAHASLSDVVSNILLFIPFGILRMWLWSARVRGKRPLLPTLVTAAYGLILGVVIESGQTLSPGRISSLLDALCNGLGAFIGAIWGLVLVRSLRGSFKAIFVHVLRNQPTLLLLCYLLLGVLANSYFPFDVTLDVSAVWQNIKRSQLIPFQKGFHQYWFELLIEKGAIFAGIGYLVLSNLQRLWRGTGAGLAWLLCCALVCAIETGKVFFAGRAFYAENVMIASLGALLGIILLPSLVALSWVKRRPEAVGFALVLGFLIYLELSPFDWIVLTELPERFSRIEWLPFKAYYSAEPLGALFDLQKKNIFVDSAGFCSDVASADQIHCLAPAQSSVTLLYHRRRD